jgi:beta-glucosidase
VWFFAERYVVWSAHFPPLRAQQNNEETNRHGVTEIVDDRTRFEMYYPPFRGAIDAGVGSMMCSYNKINAGPTQKVGDNLTWSCENPLTLKRDLKERLNFTG